MFVTACHLGKHVRLPFSSSVSVSYAPFQLIHTDVWTSPVSSCSGFKFYLVLIDDLTHYLCTFSLRAKSDAFSCLISFHAYVQTQFQLPVSSPITIMVKNLTTTLSAIILLLTALLSGFPVPTPLLKMGKPNVIIRTLNDLVLCSQASTILCQTVRSLWPQHLPIPNRWCSSTYSRPRACYCTCTCHFFT